MRDVDLKRLADLNPPPVREEARVSALEAALAAFDDRVEASATENSRMLSGG